MTNDRYYPESLKSFPIWALWRLEYDKNGQVKKMPYSPHYNGHASSDNPRTWGTFVQAVSKYESNPTFYNGISLAISEDYDLVFIDIDHCLDEDGVMNDLAYTITESFHEPQYIEVSQSGTGLHIITLGTLPKNFKNSGNGVEMYSKKRFCALTGNVIYQGEPNREQCVVDEIFQRYKTPDKTIKSVSRESGTLNNSDKWVIDHASGRGRFDSLFSGNWVSAGYNSQSEADIALCLILAFWTDCNIDQMDRIFRSSGLFRDKWERKDYRENTLQTAISQCDETLSEYQRRTNKEGGERLDKALREEWDN